MLLLLLLLLLLLYRYDKFSVQNHFVSQSLRFGTDGQPSLFLLAPGGCRRKRRHRRGDGACGTLSLPWPASMLLSPSSGPLGRGYNCQAWMWHNDGRSSAGTITATSRSASRCRRGMFGGGKASCSSSCRWDDTSGRHATVSTTGEPLDDG